MNPLNKYKPTTELVGFNSIKFLMKLKSLFSKTIGLHLYRLKDIKDNGSTIVETEKVNKAAGKVIGILVISGVSYYFASKYALKKIPPIMNKKLIGERDTIHGALMGSHSKEQQHLWDEIKRVSLERDSLSSSIESSLFNEGDSGLSPFKFIATIFLSKKDRLLKGKSKWLQIQTNKYEASLNSNQLVLYKNLYETDLKILSRTGILKTVLYVGVPLLVLPFLAKGMENKLESWESAITEWVDY